MHTDLKDEYIFPQNDNNRYIAWQSNAEFNTKINF